MLRPRTGRLAGILMAMVLLAAACGTDSATVETSPASGSADGDGATSANDGDSAEPTAEADEPAETDDSADSDSESEAVEPEPIGDHEFPDLGTVNIANGSTVNLADELAGGDTPVLLWFFAPH